MSVTTNDKYYTKLIADPKTIGLHQALGSMLAWSAENARRLIQKWYSALLSAGGLPKLAYSPRSCEHHCASLSIPKDITPTWSIIAHWEEIESYSR